jgi:DNA-binding transcriptional MerR regulator
MISTPATGAVDRLPAGNFRPMGEGAVGDEPRMTIDELAAASHMTVRNIRAHQSRGLLPPPHIEGRTGYYGPFHLRRLIQIRRLQDEGLNLAAILKVVVEGRLTDAAVDPFDEEQTALVDSDELMRRLRIAADDPAIARALADGLVAIDGDAVRVISPRLIAAAEEMSALGVPLGSQLDAVEVVREASELIAEAFLHLVDDHLAARLTVDNVSDPERMRHAVGQLRQVASTVVDVQFNQAMSTAIRQRYDDDAQTSGQG